MVIRELLNEAIKILKDADTENAVFDANQIVKQVLGLNPIDMVLSYQKEAEEDKISQVREMAKRRAAKEPLQYILGVQEFMGLEFAVNENVLIPRADTETLVEAVLGINCGMNVLDICTGSGCIALSIAHYNKKAYVLGLDISEKALETAEENAKKLNLTERVRFEKKDILNEIPKGTFDIVVSNPPYIEHDIVDTLDVEVKMHEPHLALDGGADGMDFYRRIIEIAPCILKEKGKIYFEVGYNQADAVGELLKKDFINIGTIKDLCGVNRVVYAEKKE